MILTTKEVITATLKVILATTKVIFTTGIVITATLNVISAITKVNLALKYWCHNKKLSKPLQSDFGDWRSDHSHFKSYIRHHEDELSHKQNHLVHWRSDQSNFVVTEIVFKVSVITSSVVKLLLNTNNIFRVYSEYLKKWDHSTCNTIKRINRNEVNGFIKGCHD